MFPALLSHALRRLLTALAARLFFRSGGLVLPFGRRVAMPAGRHSWRPVPGRHKAAAAFRMAQAVEHSLSPGRVWRLPVVAENVLAVSACLSGGSGRPFGLFCRSDRIFCQPSCKSCLPSGSGGRLVPAVVACGCPAWVRQLPAGPCGGVRCLRLSAVRASRHRWSGPRRS